MVEEVANASKFSRTSEFAPFALERGHFGTFRQVLVKVFKIFVVKETTIAGPQMGDFMELPLDFIFESFPTVPTPVFGFDPRLSFEARWRDCTIGSAIFQARVVRIRDVQIDPG